MSRSKAFAETPLPLFEEAEAISLPTSGRLPSYIRDHRARLRERFMAGGAGAVPDYEFLELVLFSVVGW